MGFFFVFINIAFRSLYIGIENTRVIIYATILIASINILLDYVLIFGEFGFDAMGIKGAAIASVIAEACGSIFLLFYSLSRKYLAKYSVFELTGFSIDLMKNISKTSLPVMLQYFISLSGWFIFFLFVEKMGEHNLAISNIIRNAYIIMLIPVWGFAAATNTLISNTIGRGNSTEVLSLTFKIVRLCIFTVTPIVIISIIFSNEIISIFTNDISLINDSKSSFYVITASAFFIAIGITIFNAVSGTGKTIVALGIEIIVIFSYLIYVWFLSKLHNISIEVIWTSEFVYGFGMAVISYLYLRYGNWKSKNI